LRRTATAQPGSQRPSQHSAVLVRMWSTCRRRTSTRQFLEPVLVSKHMSRQSSPLRLLSTRRHACARRVAGPLPGVVAMAGNIVTAPLSHRRLSRRPLISAATRLDLRPTMPRLLSNGRVWGHRGALRAPIAAELAGCSPLSGSDDPLSQLREDELHPMSGHRRGEGRRPSDAPRQPNKRLRPGTHLGLGLGNSSRMRIVLVDNTSGIV
jgi:hypothetical protein